MSNFLFTNISRIFSAPAEVREILNGLIPAKEEKGKAAENAIEGAEDVSVNDQGEVEIPLERIIGKSKELFGDKVYSDLGKKAVESADETDKADFKTAARKIAKQVNDSISKEIVSRVGTEYNLRQTEKDRLESQLKKENKTTLNRIADEYEGKKKVAEAEFKNKQKVARDADELKEAEEEYKVSVDHIINDFSAKVKDQVQVTVDSTPTTVVERIEKRQEERKIKDVEEDARAHMRGFSRTIPSFIMAYGDENLTLQNFDDYTEDDVFEEVTGITEEEFRFLRDGGEYVDEETNEKKHFEGHLFDEVVFNDSIKQFLQLKDKLSDYFNESNSEDIFDYIPPQKTNQIYTPKAVVKRMVDDLEENEPAIFSDSNKTFADLYMKSGLYITEIVKRLFRNERMKELYPDDQKRIEHIMGHQVYGLAPTRIIYLIATNYIFGFDENIKKSVLGKHFKQIDAAKYAKEGTLGEVVRKEFGEDE